MPRFQYISDIHLEFRQEYQTYTIPASAPHLILAGDIGNLVSSYGAYLSFLERHVGAYELIFLVLGNHDYYHAGPADTAEAARRLEAEPVLQGKVVLLDRRRYDVPGSSVTVLGCTLWSAIPAAAEAAVLDFVPDFRAIGGWDVAAHNAAHEADVSWLRAEVARAGAEGRALLVVTHYAPAVRGTSKPQYDGSAVGAAFATDLLRPGGGGGFGGVRCWVYGHTHYITDFRVEGVRVVANARGFPGENMDIADAKTDEERMHAFDITRTLTID